MGFVCLLSSAGPPTRPSAPPPCLGRAGSTTPGERPQGLARGRPRGALGTLDGHVRPVEAAAGEQHVSNEGLDGGFTYQADEEKLLDDGRGDGAQRGQPQEQFAEAAGLVGVLAPHVFLQGALRLLLQALDVRRVRQATGICPAPRGEARGANTVSERWPRHPAGPG